MIRSWPVMAALLAGAAWGQAPDYAADNIVNASDYSPGPFAPNSVLTIFGTNLAWSTQQLAETDIVNNALPTTLDSVAVYVDNWPAPVIFVSPTQINFIIPGNEVDGSVPVRVVREGVTGPEITLQLIDAAPALFALAGYTIAAHADGTLLTPDAPANAGDVVVVYATGLGKTQPNPAPGVIPLTPDRVAGPGALAVYLNGAAIDPGLIFYAGVTPYSAGLYQINLFLPGDTPTNPEIRVSVGTQMSLAGLLLNVQ
ncbi:MAG: IPT/TIG domain-containing protein [Bryobacteraceae bacterium]